jgi:hypothetical protein
MNIIRWNCQVLLVLLLPICALAQSANQLKLENGRITVRWNKTNEGWKVSAVAVKKGDKWVKTGQPSGEYTFLYAAEKPNEAPDTSFTTNTGANYPEKSYIYQQKTWSESTNPVSLNKAGQAYHFFPEKGFQQGASQLVFEHNHPLGKVKTTWKFDPLFPTDIIVTQTIAVGTSGYFSFATPTVATIDLSDMGWAMIPGYFQGNAIQPDFVLGYTYGQGVPAVPAVYRERTASTLSPLVTTKAGISIAAIPDPAYCRNPWDSLVITHDKWNIGLSHKNRKAELSPTLYYPVLGEPKSKLTAGDVIHFSYRISMIDGDWFKVLNHAVYDVFRFKESLALRESKQSLTVRIQKMHLYLKNPTQSLWNIREYKGTTIGAQSYLGGVLGANKDAMKNADYGAMWMLANATGDQQLKQDVLPYALNFKIQQQIKEEGFFKGALEGQYYLANSQRFVEEWGEVVEPIAVTYYTMLDIGNVLLFEPDNQQLKQSLRAGADWLLKTQDADGSWAVAYDKQSGEKAFLDLKDLRPTFYGLMIAYQLLKDPRYLVAAEKGAKWFVSNATAKGHFLGVCGDARYNPDFATAQSAQALLDLYDLTKNNLYKSAAIATAKFYTASIYTHPIPDNTIKKVNGIMRRDWEIAQSGLSFEHGGIFGSANTHGPIQLASHAGLFVRMHQLTGEKIFIDMARAAAWGRDAFVDPATSVASYYWRAMNRGAGPYPHHAWWQIGWLTDYLMAEAEFRSRGAVKFPRGFVTPKVGPHQTYGFKPGTINGEKVKLVIDSTIVKLDHPAIDHILAKTVDGKKYFVVLLNNSAHEVVFNIGFGDGTTSSKKIPAAGIAILTVPVEGKTKKTM